jgi:NADH-quinone oxidoreductase subunit E
MPALDIAQEEIGWLPREAVEEVAALLDLDPGYVEGVSTFYTLFHLKPTGAHHFYVCTNISCALRGAYDLLDHMKERIGVREHGEVSEDGLFSFEEVECLGACEFAPMMRYQHRFHHDLTKDKVDALVQAARAGGAPAAARPRPTEQLDPAAAEGRPQPARPARKENGHDGD